MSPRRALEQVARLRRRQLTGPRLNSYFRASGFPWLAILDADGKVLATSNKPDDGSNIGFPSQPDEIDHFLHILRTTAQRMTPDDFAKLKTYLEKVSSEKK